MSAEEHPNQRLSRSEEITALAHYYRAEVQRSLAWRERLDRTTNWAVGATAAFLGFGFSHPEINHVFYVFGMAIIYVLLFVESRRFRYYDAYEYRIRLLNDHFIYGVLVDRAIPEDLSFDDATGFDETTFWRAELASDLRFPQYKMPRSTALGRRIYANYGYLFAILIIGWLFKIKLHPVVATTWRQYYDQAAIGLIPGWMTFLFMVCFVAHLYVLMRMGRRSRIGQDQLLMRHKRHRKKARTSMKS
jgi:uncharacterized membrane protein